ncbi:MAG: PhnD/SsuA/transferrin family substrate-binding protein [Leptothrix ochracea]|uniref:PhnD/SsuA/transferrin family substrate-binding protein n=1 Tax=Leptothrix ochracea TaxID=735331 RepID=UPI0034E26C68
MTSRLHFSVCPHDTAKNVAGWFLINTYLQRRLDLAIHFEPCDNVNDEREQVLAGGYELVYANPYSALRYCEQRQFVPIARPTGLYDETLLIARAGEALPTTRPVRIASASDRLIVHFLGLTLLEKVGLRVSDCESKFVGNHLKVLQAVVSGQCELGFLFNETWQGLSAKTQSGLQILEQTRNQQAFHCFCVGPALADRAEEVQAILCSMKDDPQGRRILEDLRFAGFEPVTMDGLHHLNTLVGMSA